MKRETVGLVGMDLELGDTMKGIRTGRKEGDVFKNEVCPPPQYPVQWTRPVVEANFIHRP